RLEAIQRVPPERLGLCGILALQPGDVVAVARGWFAGPRSTVLAFCRVRRQHVAYDDRHAPAVEDDVMRRPQHVPLLVLQPHESQAHERRLFERKASALVGLQALGETRFLLGGAQGAPVFERPRQGGAFPYDLQWPFAPFPEESRAQNVVPRNGRFPRLLERDRIERTVQTNRELLAVDRLVAFVQA